MTQLSRKLGNAIGPKMPGRCLTTLIALKAIGRDPACKLPRECLRLWLTCWVRQPSIHDSIMLTWPGLVQEMRAMPPSQRTRHIRGPQGAVICYLLQAGRRPDSPTSWTTPTADD
eukprot:5799667-Pyramimonas_sp.AAC.1